MTSQRHEAGYEERPIRWGIVGAGWIASEFAGDLRLLDDAEVVAIASRQQSTADAFADQFGIARRYGSYRSMMADPNIDVVYVATPHPMHFDAAMMAIEGGKNVLVEKAFTLNADEANRLVNAARDRGVFLMEGMWSRFLPHMVDVRQVLASGVIGDIRMVTASHGQWFSPNASSRVFAPALGGGALLDLGVYAVSFASMVLGGPTSVAAVSSEAFTGVDGQTSMIFGYDGGRQAVLTTTLQARSANVATIVGTEARIEIDPLFFCPSSFSVISRDDVVTRHSHQPVGQGLRYEAAEVGRCLRAGLLESPVMPLEETIQIMATMDEVRRQIGLTYPNEVSGFDPGI